MPIEQAPLEDLNAARQAIHTARQQLNDERAAVRAAANAEERAQLKAIEKLEATNAAVDAAFAKAESEGRMMTLEEINNSGMNRIEMLHAQIKLGRQRQPDNTPLVAPPNKEISARTKLEMEAGRRAVERAQGQREKEMARGAEVASGSPPPAPTAVGDMPTPSTPVFIPNEPVRGVDQNKNVIAPSRKR